MVLDVSYSRVLGQLVLYCYVCSVFTERRVRSLHFSGKGAAVFAEGLSGAVASGLGKVRYLN